jgi:succinate dehydrogenase/fumarate reductase flavoprotein subunit
VRDLEYKVRRLIGDYVVSPKNEHKLHRWMEWADRFRQEIDHEVLVRNGHELSKLYEVENIVVCATFSARASMERKESRWGDAHRRADYPEKDDEHWLCHVDLQKGEDSDEMKVTKRPITRELGPGVAS